MDGFIIIGGMSVLGYKDIFQLIKDNKIWVSETRGKSPYTGKEYKYYSYHRYYNTNNGVRDLPTFFYTNIKYKEHHLELTKSYTPEQYSKLDNYDAIEVNRIKDIPIDYQGYMSVPVPFLLSYNPNEFEILSNIINDAKLNGKSLYKRLLIRKKYG